MINIREIKLTPDDHAAALLEIVSHGTVGATFLVGGDAERTNLEVVEAICRVLDEVRPRPHGSHRQAITFVSDRPGHDLRYAIDFSATEAALGWSPSVRFEDGLRRTVNWYLANEAWWGPLVEGDAATRRGLGMGAK